jgi:para-nitrobenzyl esterase
MKSKQKLFASLLVSAIIILVACSGTQKKTPVLNPLVRTQCGEVQGLTNEAGNVAIFKGIPYAAPPVGELRWKEPQPPIPWQGVYDATKFCASCMQPKNSRLPWTQEFMVEGDNFSEDCLFLNIWTSAKTAADKLPVLLFLHGGAMTEGSGSIVTYDGEALAAKGIIVITINYRLGVLGLLVHPELTAESAHNTSGNYGYLDQVAALIWVKNNIAAFGGDPSRVTISGQSAGAGSVRMLLASPLAAGLFHGAITESGSTFTGGAGGGINAFTEAEKRGLEFAKNKGASSIAQLRAMSAKEIIAVDTTKPNVRFGGIVDGYFQTSDIKTIYSEGKQNDVPFITGMNSGETRYSGEKNKEFEELYPSGSKDETMAVEKVAGQEQSRLNAYLWLEFRSKTSKTNGYEYYFSRGIPWPEHPEFGAFHTGEIPYVFNNLRMLNRPFTEVDTMVTNVMSSYWVNFVKTGNPNGEGLPGWRPYSETKEAMEIGEHTGMIPIAATQERYDFLKEQLLKPRPMPGR